MQEQPLIQSATDFLTMMSALSTAVQQLVEHLVKKRIDWFDSESTNATTEARRTSGIHAVSFVFGTALSWYAGLEPLQALGSQTAGPWPNALLAGVMISFGSSFVDEALGALRAFKQANESLKK